MRYEVTTLEVCADGMERLRSQRELILCAGACGPDDASAVLEAFREDVAYIPEDADADAVEEALTAWAEGDGPAALASALGAVKWDEWKPDGPDSDNGESIPCKLYIRDQWPEGAAAIVASWREESLSREAAETDLRLLGMAESLIAEALLEPV